DEEDLLDVVGRLGLDDYALRPVGRARVAVDEDRTRVGEELDEAGVGGPNDVADRGRVLEARDADHDVGLAEPADLLADGLREARLRHGGKSTGRIEATASSGDQAQRARLLGEADA